MKVLHDSTRKRRVSGQVSKDLLLLGGLAGLMLVIGFTLCSAVYFVRQMQQEKGSRHV